MRLFAKFTFLSLLFANSMGFAQGQSRVQSAGTQSAPTSRFSAEVALTTSSNFYKQDSLDRENSNDLLLLPGYKLSDRFALGGKVILTETKAQEETVTASNAVLGFSIKGPAFTPNLNMGFKVSGIAPTNRESRENDSYRGGFALGSNLVWTRGVFSTAYGLSGTRNIHEYNMSAEGAPNIQYKLNHSLDIALTLRKWTLSASGIYGQGWTYRNFMRQSYGSGFGVEYAATKSWALIASIDNAVGPLFKANGRDTNIEAFDQNTSQISAGIKFTN